jgi:hypothetical protein
MKDKIVYLNQIVNYATYQAAGHFVSFKFSDLQGNLGHGVRDACGFTQ